MKGSSQFLDHLIETFRLFGPIRYKKMFGGYGIYHQDLMIGLVADDTLYLKTDSQSAPLFREVGSLPFEYNKNGVLMKMSYFSAPVEMFDEPETARQWAKVAYDAAVRSRTKAMRHPK